MKNLTIIIGYGILSVMITTSAFCQPDNNGNSIISDFEDLSLEPDTFWNGSDGSGGFDSGLARFYNNYDTTYGSWTGWSFSSMANDSTPGYFNQYSAITASGVEPVISEGSTYGVGYVAIDFISLENTPISVRFTDDIAHDMEGLYVTNSTYTALSMEQGDDFTKKFGGETGDDPDWFMISIWGMKEGAETDTVDFYLADYRFDDNSGDYIVKTWEWVDLSSLGKVDSLMFCLNSSDVGEYGMNTPGYFCIDNLYIVRDVSSTAKTDGEPFAINIYPNPVNGKFRISTSKQDIFHISIFSMTGDILFNNKAYISGREVDISNYPAGSYILRVQKGNTVRVNTIIKQ